VKYTQQDVEDNLGLVHMVVQKSGGRYGNHLVDYDDLISEGTIGLMHALERFDPTRGFKFSSYAVRCIRGYMLQGNRYLFKERWNAKVRGENVTTISVFKDDSLEPVFGVNDHGLNATETINHVNRAVALKRIRKFLSPRQRQIFDMILKKKMNQTEISIKLKVSRQAVNQAYMNGIKNVRVGLGLEEAA